MNPFSDILKALHARLDLPQPEKYRILLEISADLHDAAAHYQAKGLTEHDAVRKAQETFDVSDETLAQLQAVHHNLFRRWIDRLSAQAWSRWEKAVFAVIFLFILLYSGREMLTGRFFVMAGGFVWPVALVMAAAGVLILWKAYTLYLKQDHRPERLRRGLPAIVGTAVLCLFLSVFGLILDAWLVLAAMIADTGRAPELAMRYLLAGASVMIAGLTAALIISLAWHLLMNRVYRIEQSETAAFLEDNP